jgi:hypothetical protein
MGHHRASSLAHPVVFGTNEGISFSKGKGRKNPCHQENTLSAHTRNNHLNIHATLQLLVSSASPTDFITPEPMSNAFKSQVPNDKSQINSKLQFQITKPIS